MNIQTTGEGHKKPYHFHIKEQGQSDDQAISRKKSELDDEMENAVIQFYVENPERKPPSSMEHQVRNSRAQLRQEEDDQGDRQPT